MAWQRNEAGSEWTYHLGELGQLVVQLTMEEPTPWHGVWLAANNDLVMTLGDWGTLEEAQSMCLARVRRLGYGLYAMPAPGAERPTDYTMSMVFQVPPRSCLNCAHLDVVQDEGHEHHEIGCRYEEWSFSDGDGPEQLRSYLKVAERCLKFQACAVSPPPPRVPRERTAEEVRQGFLEQVAAKLDYALREDRWPTTKEKLDGLVFGILGILDGVDGGPGFIVAPDPHETDRQYHLKNGDDWFPENYAVRDQVKADIAGPLHEVWCRLKR